MALVKLPQHTTRVILEAIEIILHQNFNKNGGYQLILAWKIIHMVKQQRDATTKLTSQILC
jgi:hypothetical protein